MIKRLIVVAILVLCFHSAHAARREPAAASELQTSPQRPAQVARPVNVECMRDTADNQRRAAKYIADLVANPKNNDRPALKYNDACGSDIAYNEVVTILDRAERMAQSGMADKISEPDFRFNGNE